MKLALWLAAALPRAAQPPKLVNPQLDTRSAAAGLDSPKPRNRQPAPPPRRAGTGQRRPPAGAPPPPAGRDPLPRPRRAHPPVRLRLLLA